MEAVAIGMDLLVKALMLAEMAELQQQVVGLLTRVQMVVEDLCFQPDQLLSTE